MYFHIHWVTHNQDGCAVEFDYRTFLYNQTDQINSCIISYCIRFSLNCLRFERMESGSSNKNAAGWRTIVPMVTVVVDSVVTTLYCVSVLALKAHNGLTLCKKGSYHWFPPREIPFI